MTVLLGTNTQRTSDPRGRAITRTTDGTVWTFSISDDDGLLHLHYSRDDGATWTDSGWTHAVNNVREAGVAMAPDGTFVVGVNPSSYQNLSADAWRVDLATVQVTYISSLSLPFTEDGSNVYWHEDMLIGARSDGGYRVVFGIGANHTSFMAGYVRYADLDAAGAWSAVSAPSGSESQGNGYWMRLEWKHDGSGVGDGDTDGIVVAWEAAITTYTPDGAGGYTGTRDTWPSTYEPRYAQDFRIVYDGTKTILFHSRDSYGVREAHHTTPGQAGTAIGALPQHPDGLSGIKIDASRDAQGNVVVWGGSSGAFLHKIIRTAGGSWGSWAVVSSAYSFRTVHRSIVQAGNGSHHYLWRTGSSPFPIAMETHSFNVPPNAPTLTTMAGGEIVDRAAANRASHTFSDPDGGDSQSAFDHRYRLVGSSTWTEAHAPTPNGYVDYPAGTFAAGDYERQVRTYDAQGAVGPWSPSGFFTAADAPATPTITAPVHLSTVAATVEVTWSTSVQDAYQLQVLDGGLVEYDSGAVAHTTIRSRTVSMPVNNEDRTIRVRVKGGGLWSAWYSVTVSVSYTRPPVPVVGLQVSGTALLVTVTNPAPAVGEPNVTHNRVLVNDGLDDGETVRVAELAPNGSWTYWTPRSGVHYEGRVRVVAVGDNGTEVSSA